MMQRRGARRTLVGIGVGVLACLAHAGEASGQPGGRRNAVYLELLGNAVQYSVNYERTLIGTWYARIGAGYLAFPETDGDEIDGLGMVPLMIGYVTPTAPHGVEVGVGLAPVFTRGNWDDVLLLSSETRIVGTGTIGYRFARARGRFLLRAAFTPLFGAGGFSPWGGGSVGFRF